MRDEQIARSKAIQRQTGKTFHLATRLLPERVRHPTYVLYAFFRIADEVVDDPDPDPPADQRAALERFRAEALGEKRPESPVIEAFVDLRAQAGIDDADVNAFVDAMIADVDTDRYATYADLESYMDGSAAAVGRMMTAVMDPDDPDVALPHATALGEAFQMTNFMRDVREDVLERDRIYLPQSTLATHGVSDRQIEALEFSPEFAAAMREELARTETLYETGVAGIKYLPDDCQFPVLLAAVLYADHHRLIREYDYDVLSRTPQLGTLRKVKLLAATRWHWAWNPDPEAVFWRVSSLPTAGIHGESGPRSADTGEGVPLGGR